jgi:hypothetical protein
VVGFKGERHKPSYRTPPLDADGFLRFASLARWVDYPPWKVIFKNGQHISEVVVVLAGDLEAILGGNSRLAIRTRSTCRGCERLQWSGQSSGCSGRRSRESCKVGPTHRSEFTASRPELGANLPRIVSLDIAAKLRDIASPSLTAEVLVPK